MCLILGLAALARTAGAATAANDTAAVVRQAQTRFESGDLAGAATLLDRAPVKGADDRELADIANLRGAIALRRKQYDKAKAAFSQASAHDPKLWAARFNAAEVSFRRGDYAEASKQFDALREQTQGIGVSEERRLAQYKHLLAASMAGREKPVQDYLAGHHNESTPPLEYFYLNAALEQRRGHAQKASQWLAQAGSKYPSATGGVYAESFQRLGWSTANSGRLVAVVNNQESATAPPAPAPSTIPVKAAVSAPAIDTIPVPAAPPVVAPAKAKSASVKAPDAETPPTSNHLPPAPKPEFRFGPDTPAYPAFRAEGPAPRDVNGQMPPLVDARQPQTLVEDAAGERTGLEAPAVLGKPSSGGRKPRATPSPSASPAESPNAAPAATADASPNPSPAPAATPTPGPAASPTPAFVQKYEAAYVKYLEKDFPAAKALLEEADIIQPGQKSTADLRDLIFKSYYEGAYVSFRKGDYPTALEQLGNAEGIKPSNPDSLNLRGLVFSRQRNYEQAESSFRKASQLDPTFYAAKFNYAELPFNYRNYTVARSRFEELFAQTDPAKQPVEAEITQFKVFLTLLLEGKIDAARSFMDHFKFTGATPARYFCQAALDFYGGNMEKAQGWVDSAGKEFKPQLVSIFKESFYRIGWMIDVNGTPSLAGRPTPPPSPAASPSVPAVASASASPTASPAAVLAMNSPAPAASPGTSPLLARASVSPVPTATPAVAKASVTPAPTAAASVPPIPALTATPAVAKASPSPLPTAAVAVASATPTPATVKASVTPAPTVAVAMSSATPSATPALVVAKASATPTPVAAVAAVAKMTVTPVPAASATPVPSVAGATPALAQATSTPESESTPTEEAAEEDTSESERPIQIILGAFIVLSTISSQLVVRRAVAQREARLRARRNSLAYGDREEALETEEAQTPR